MAKRSINAQIEEVSQLLEDKRNQTRSMRGSDLSRAEERLLRLECALTTLQWVRDHADVIRQLVQVDKGKRSAAVPGRAAEPPDKATQRGRSSPGQAKTS